MSKKTNTHKDIEKLVFSQFIEQIPQFVWWKDVNSVFWGCNENVARYAGLKNAKEIVGLTDFDIYENKSDAESVRKVDQEIIASGKPQLNFEEQLTVPKMGKRWLSTSKSPLYDENKNIIGTIGWFNDITELKELKIELDEKNKILFNYNLELNNTLKSIELLNIDLERFTYAASHDLKGPLRFIKRYTQLLLEEENDTLSTKSTKYITSIHEAVDRMDTIVKDILDYAISGSKNQVRELVNLNELVALKILDINPTLNTEKTIKFDLPQKEIKVYKKLIGLVFYNLITNGLKFNNSLNPRVEIAYKEKERFYYFTVTDNGIGISPEYIKDIFKPFQKGTDKNSAGVGLGLSICQRVIALHCGDIWIAHSIKGKTVIKFSISKV